MKSIIREEYLKEISGDMNPHTAYCQANGCGCKIDIRNPQGATSYECFSRGKNSRIWLCAEHSHIQPYHSAPLTFREKAVNADWKVGHEIETSEYTDEVFANLLSEGYWAENDCTCKCEFVGPVQTYAQSAAMVKVMGKWIESGIMNTSGCGHHLHVSTPEYDAEAAEWLRENADIFEQFTRLIIESDKTVEIFGRDFCEYAEASVRDWDRYGYINLTNDSNIEFRLPFFVNAEQYEFTISAVRYLTMPMLVYACRRDRRNLKIELSKRWKTILRGYEKKGYSARFRKYTID